MLTESGETGSGKSNLACALGIEACKRYYNAKYVQLPNLFLDLKTARKNNCYKKTMAKYATLILDEWMLIKPIEDEQNDIFELLHHRRKKYAAIFC